MSAEITAVDGKAPKDVTDLMAKVGRGGLVPALESATVSVDLAPYRSANKNGPPGNVEQINWPDIFSRGSLTGEELQSLVIPPRLKLLGDFFCEGDLGFIFAARGVGKTWLAMLIGLAIAEGSAAGPWPAPGKHPVLYVDGEMPLELMQERSRALSKEGAGVRYLNHEQLFNKTGHVLNLTERECQQAIMALCQEWRAKALVLDNLSCLFRGVKENEADAWEKILPWLLELRRQKVAVVFVVHAGRNGQMRGTSRREDAAAWVIRLDDATDAASARSGAKFISTFTKASRNTQETPAPIEWSINTNAGTGKAKVEYKNVTGEDAVLSWVRHGLTSCGQIASEMGVSPGQVSRLATQLIKDKRLIKDGRGYALPEGELESDE